MHTSLKSVCAAAALTALSALPAVAEGRSQPCAERTQVVERLAEKYGETLQSVGMHSNNGVLEVYASKKTGSWTILVTSPDGKTCLIAAGQMWENDVTPLTKPGKDA